jgi:hypothetical protein
MMVTTKPNKQTRIIRNGNVSSNAQQKQVHNASMSKQRAERSITYNELMVVHFGGAGEQRKREAREEEHQPGPRRCHGAERLMPPRSVGTGRRLC